MRLQSTKEIMKKTTRIIGLALVALGVISLSACKSNKGGGGGSMPVPPPASAPYGK